MYMKNPVSASVTAFRMALLASVFSLASGTTLAATDAQAFGDGSTPATPVPSSALMSGAPLSSVDPATTGAIKPDNPVVASVTGDDKDNKACKDAKAAAERSGTQASEKAALEKCEKPKYDSATAAMMDPNITAQAPDPNAKITMLDTKTVAANVDKGTHLFSQNGLGIGSRASDIKLTGGSTAQLVSYAPAQTTTLGDVDTKSWYSRYDPASVSIGGDGSGMIRCNGGGACPGGKWGVDTNDGSIRTSMNMGRAETFQSGNWFQNPTTGMDQGYLVPTDGSVPAGTKSFQIQTAEMINSIGQGKGMSPEAIRTAIGDVYRESKFRDNTGPGTTSAYGYGQYVGDTWVGSARDANGNVLNRNNGFNQMNVLLDDVNDRYNTYANSPSLQRRFGNFGTYDYVVHHDGNALASENHSFAINYYRDTSGAGNTLADYVMNNSNQNGGVVVGTSPNSTLGTTLGGSGGRTPSGGVVTSNGTGTGNPVIDAVLGIGNGNTSQLTNLPGMLNTGGTQLSTNSSLSQLLTAYLMSGMGNQNTGGSGQTATRPTHTSTSSSHGVTTVTEVTVKDGKKTTKVTKTDSSGKVLEDTTTVEDVTDATS